MAVKKTPQLPTSRIAGKAKVSTVYSRYAKNSRVPDPRPDVSNTSIDDYRYETVPATALRLLARKNGNVGSSIFSFVEVAKSGWTVKAYDTGTNQYSQAGVEAATSVLAMIDTIYNYQRGYADVMTVDALLETMLREATVSSFIGAELVLDKARLPERIVPVPFESIVWKSRADGTKYPAQTGAFTGGGEVSLDTATFWTAIVHADLTRTYVTPMLEPAIDTTYMYAEFVEDMRRSLKQTGHSRLVILLNSEKITSAAPDDIKNDSAKMSAFLEDQRVQVENLVKTMAPEDALVAYDSVEADDLQTKSVKADYTDLLTAISGMLATSLKSHPSILGLRLEGSQSLSNTESLVFLKIAKAIQRPVEDVMSRAMTLAVRLYGIDAYVKFKFEPIDLRPESELEAYRSMRQARVLEQLSLGFITDDQAAELLNTGSRPAGAEDLRGTMFHQKDNTMADNVPGTSRDPQGEVLTPDTPTKAGGKSQ